VVEPLHPATTKALATDALRAGSFFVTDHARNRLAERRIKLGDVHRIIKSGVYRHAHLEDGDMALSDLDDVDYRGDRVPSVQPARNQPRDCVSKLAAATAGPCRPPDHGSMTRTPAIGSE